MTASGATDASVTYWPSERGSTQANVEAAAPASKVALAKTVWRAFVTARDCSWRP
jgi:hypothetical protein